MFSSALDSYEIPPMNKRRDSELEMRNDVCLLAGYGTDGRVIP
jgi:hypothetical protein